MQEFNEFALFKKMIVPQLSVILFWVSILFLLVGTIGVVEEFGVLYGVLYIIISPFIVRIYFEYIIVQFKIHEALEDIRKILSEKNRHTQ